MTNLEFSNNHIKEFKKMGVNTIYLFGSQTKKNTHPLSDFDIGIVFSNPEKYKNSTKEIYSKFYNIFTELLPKKYLKNRFQKKLHEFDIVFLQFSPIGLQFEATKGEILYEEDKEERLNYEEYILKKYCDLKYFRDIQKKAILDRI